METNFEEGDLLVWKPEFLKQKLRYNKSKNKKKHTMVDHFDIPAYGQERQWPEGVFEFVGYRGSDGGVSSGIPYIPERGSWIKLEERERSKVWYNEYFDLDLNQVMLAPEIYGEEVYTKEELKNLGF